MRACGGEEDSRTQDASFLPSFLRSCCRGLFLFSFFRLSVDKGLGWAGLGSVVAGRLSVHLGVRSLTATGEGKEEEGRRGLRGRESASPTARRRKKEEARPQQAVRTWRPDGG